MLLEEKSILARLMATENLFIEERNVSTAYFDLKNRVLTVPILNGNLSNHVYDLFLGHEVGHALETPINGYHNSVYNKKLNQSILNVCEDARIEKKIKRKFPGIRHSFNNAYKELMEMDFFSIKDVNVNELNLIDRINLHTKVGISLNIQFNEVEQSLLNEVENTETFKEVVAVAIKIQKYMREQSRKEKNQGENIFQKMMDQFPESFTPPENVETVVEKEEDPSGNGETHTVNVPSGNKKEESADENGIDDDNQDLSSLDSKTHDAFRKNEKKLFETNPKGDVVYCNVPKIHEDDFLIPYKKILNLVSKYPKSMRSESIAIYENLKKINFNEFQKFKNSNDRIVSHLVKEFELRKNADQNSRARVAKSGDINMSRLHDYQFTDDIFRRITRVPNGKSHGLVMFIDWSGSMSNHIHSTIKQLLTLVYFCRKVNIPFEVYAFTSGFHEENSPQKLTKTKFKIGDLYFSNTHMALMNFFSSKMKNSEITQMASFLYSYNRRGSYMPNGFSLSGTPLNECVMAAFEVVPEFKKKNNLQIVNTIFLTDGDGHECRSIVNYKDNKNANNIGLNSILSGRISKLFFRDVETKCTVEVSKYFGYTKNHQTVALLQLLKQRARCNIISFFVSSTSGLKDKIIERNNIENKLSGIYRVQSREEEKQISELRKNKFYILKTSYYDEMYLIKSDTIDIEDEEFEIEADKTNTRSIASAFTKYNENKMHSRIFLNRFVKMIS